MGFRKERRQIILKKSRHLILKFTVYQGRDSVDCDTLSLSLTICDSMLYWKGMKTNTNQNLSGKPNKVLGKITSENPNDPYSNFICTCGNTPMISGFVPCNEKGEEVEPTPEEWTTNCYVCGECGNIIEQKTLEILGIACKETMKRNLDRI